MSTFGLNSLRGILPSIPEAIADALANEFAEMESRFARRDWGPAELNGGRFAEAVLRFLEWSVSGGYTPIGTQINREQILNRVKNNTSLADGLRFHVAKCSEILMDIRNKRDVAHLGNAISVDEMDAQLVMTLASWALAEIIREAGGLSAQDAQSIIVRLSSRRFPLVEEVGGDLVVLCTDLSASEKALVALYHLHPDPMNITALRKAIDYTNSTQFRAIIRQQTKAGITYVKEDNVFLTSKGVTWVEKNINMHLEV